MKRMLFYLLVISFGATSTSCENDTDFIEIDYQFEATVIGKGLDCGDTYLIDLKKVMGDSKIANGTYYADKLPPQLKVAGLKIRLNSRKSTNQDLYACTIMGPGYSHGIVIDSEKVDK